MNFNCIKLNFPDSSSSSSESDSDSHSSSSSDSSKIRAKAARGVTASGGGVSAVPGGLDKKQPNKISSGTRLLSPKYIADAQKKEAAEGTRKGKCFVILFRCRFCMSLYFPIYF